MNNYYPNHTPTYIDYCSILPPRDLSIEEQAKIKETWGTLRELAKGRKIMIVDDRETRKTGKISLKKI